MLNFHISVHWLIDQELGNQHQTAKVYVANLKPMTMPEWAKPGNLFHNVTRNEHLTFREISVSASINSKLQQPHPLSWAF